MTTSQQAQAGLPIRFRSLTLSSSPSSSSSSPDILCPTLGSSLVDLVTFGPARRVVGKLTGIGRGRSGGREAAIRGVDGLVHQGELLLIIGPSPTLNSLLLRSLSSPPDLPLTSSSHLDYGHLLPSSLSSSPLRSRILFLPSSDVHFPTLSVTSSLLPVAESKAPRSELRSGLTRKEWAEKELGKHLRGLGLESARETRVGGMMDESKGLSGGEKKRLSLVEFLVADAVVGLLEEPLNGLDSSTAKLVLEYLRDWAKKGKRSLCLTSPNVSDTLLELVDKVLVVDGNGGQVWFGSVKEVEGYFERLKMGFERKKEDEEGLVEFVLRCVGSGGSERLLEKAWKGSSERKTILKEIDMTYRSLYTPSKTLEPLLSSTISLKTRWTTSSSKWTVGFGTQVKLLTQRQLKIIWSERGTYVTKTGVNLGLSVLVGSLFWKLPQTTEAAFTRGSLLLLSIMFNAYLSLGELGKAIEGRDIVKRQSDFGFFGASALAVARIAGDLPLIGVQVILFGTVTYFMAGLQFALNRFLIYILFVYATALNLSCMFRMFAALSPTYEEAIRFCGIALNILVIFAGYFVPTRSMPSGLKFIHYTLDPISRSYEAVLSNEFHSLNLSCSPSQIIPSGPSYTSSLYQSCLLPGSIPQSLLVKGSEYLSTAYDFHYERIWKNLGIMGAQAVVFLVIGVVATNWLSWVKEGRKRVWKRTEKTGRMLRKKGWSGVESGEGERRPLLEGRGSSGVGVGVGGDYEAAGSGGTRKEIKGSSLLWKDVSLWVDTELETRRLLDRVSGHLKPGRVCALLGPSGAGKSTLLNVLAGRARGSVKGSILVDGEKPGKDFYRMTGYVEQADIHEEKSTIREALEFSALLRQDASIPRSRKLSYVNHVLELLDLTHLQDAIIGTPNAGLDSCSRKLLSIAVEVVAKPTILFCDEPTTGLNPKNSAKVLKLLKKLAKSGLAVIVTIHQPSPENFESFDDVLLLQTGGKQLYFGPRSSAVPYFFSSSTSHAADALLEIASSASNSLPAKWRNSGEFEALEAIDVGGAGGGKVKRRERKSVGIGRQCWELTKRVSRGYWRDVSYSYTKLFTSTVVPMVIGFSFFQAAKKHSIVSLQNRMFSVFLLLFVPVVVMNVSIFKTVQLRSLWLARERPCKIYGATAFATSLLVSEVPFLAGCATLYFVLWYFLVGFPLQASTIAYAFGLVQIFWIFQSTWALWIVSLSSSLGTIANLLPFFLVSLEAFNGSLMPYDQMPGYWIWMYWISPFQWYVRGMLGVLLHDAKVVCAPEEVVSFLSPPGETCASYLKIYLSTNSGQLLNPSSTDLCSFCQFSTGDDWLAQLNISFDDRWRSLAILAGYSVLNVLLVYFLLYFPLRTPKMLKRNGTGKSAEMVAEEEWQKETALVRDAFV